MATLLSSTLIERTLAALPGWEGDQRCLRRHFRLPPEQDTQLRAQITRDAAVMGQRPRAERVAGGTRYVLRNPEVGGVTELDVAFAAHISDLAHQLAEDEPGIEAVREDEPEVAVAASGRAADGATSAVELRERFGRP